MTRRARALTSLSVAVLVTAGCQQRSRPLAEAFPTGRMAAPWVLDGAVWSGDFEQAAAGLGSDAAAWRPYQPTRVWLAIYRHQSNAERKTTARVFAFESADGARRAYQHFAPIDGRALQAGDEGCWTTGGVMIRWQRLVVEVFGEAGTWESEVGAAAIAGCIERRMPPGAPASP